MLFCTLPPISELALLLQVCNMIPTSYTKVPEPSSGGAPVTQLVSAESFGGHQQCGTSIECSGRNKDTEDLPCLRTEMGGVQQKQELCLQVLC